MMYTSYIPSPPLNAYIDDLYYLDGTAPHSRLKTFPLPSLHLMVNFGPAFSVSTSDQAQPFATCTQSWWVGMFNTSHIVNWPSSVQFFGIHFKPGGAAPFLHLPLSELHNQVVALDALWGYFATELREQLKAFARLSRFFSVLRSIDPMQPVDWMLIAHQADCDDQSHFNKDFVTLTGYSPSDYLRLRCRLCAQNPQQSQSLGQLPIE